MVALTAKSLVPKVWGGVHECVCITSSRVLLMQVSKYLDISPKEQVWVGSLINLKLLTFILRLSISYEVSFFLPQ